MRPPRLVFILCALEHRMSLTNQLAPTPPRGWNSYDYFGGDINEAEFLANAEYMAQHLKPFGWRYAVIDIAWHTDAGTSGPTDEGVDPNGRVRPSPRKFPSSRSGDTRLGFKPLADRVHQLGLQFGLHIMPGVNRLSIERGDKVLGTNTPVADIALPNEFNELSPGTLHYLKPDHPDSQTYYDSLFQQYAEWGVDFIKADGPGFPYRPREVEMLDTARRRCGRPIVLSTSAGCTQYSAHMNHRQRHCEMSRISEDFWDRWPQLECMFDNFRAWRGNSGPGHWADGDMLPLGRIGARHHAVNSPERPTRFTTHEQQTLLTLYSIAQSPLMLGGDLCQNTADDLALITNPDVLAVNEWGRDGHEIYRDCHHSAVVWKARMTPDKTHWAHALAVFNFHPGLTRQIPIPWSETGLPARATVRDLWAWRDLGPASENFIVEVPPHGARLFGIRPAE